MDIYTHSNIEDYLLRFTEKEGSIESHLLQSDSQNFVSNLNTNIVAIAIGNDTCTVSLNKKEYNNAVICSPYATYLKYPLDLLKSFDKLWVRGIITFFCGLLDGVFKFCKINQVAQINSKLHSVIKHPNFLNHHLPQLTQQLCEYFSDHALLFFRVNDHLDKKMMATLQQRGYLIFPDRISHLFLPNSGYMKRSNTKRDIALLRNTSYEIVMHDDITDEDIIRIHQLYQVLFIEKYSRFNPKYTLDYFIQALKNHWSHFVALRNQNGIIDAFSSWYFCDDVMVCSQIGYDTTVPKNMGIYRMLIAIMLKEAHQRQVIFNLGAGSDNFKQNRGSQPTKEYTAVYCQHLPYYRRIPWKILNLACHKLLPKILEASSI